MTVSSKVPGSSTSAPVPYDFRQPMTLAREHARVLEMAFETFARHWGTQLVGRLRVAAQVSFDSVEMRSYDEYISSLPQVTTMLVCSIEGGRRTAVVEFPLSTAMEWLDRMLGGRGTPGAVPERDLTDIEQQLMRHLMERTLGDLSYSFATVIPLETELKNIQYSPQMIQATTASTPVLVARFTVDVEGQSVAATAMLPAEDIVAALRENQGTDNRSEEEIENERRERELLDLAVQEVPVEVAVRFRPVPVHPREIVRLSVGDLLPLHQSAAQPLDVVVGDRVLAHAAAGTSGSRLAGLIVHVKENP